MNASFEYDYFSLSISNIFQSKLLLSLIILIDYFLTLIRIPSIINPSAIYYSSISLYTSLTSIYMTTNFIFLASLSLGILFIQAIFHLIKVYFSTKLPKKISAFYININELILLRLVSLIFFDILITFLIYLIRMNIIQYYVLFFIFLILSSVYFWSLLSHIRYYYSYGHSNFNYPFDSFSQSLDSVLLVIKVITALSFTMRNMLIAYYNSVILIGLICITSIYGIYVMKNQSYMIIKNLTLNKIRLSSYVFATVMTIIEWIFPLNESDYLFWIALITIVIFFAVIMITYDEMTSIPLNDKNIIINLLYFQTKKLEVIEEKRFIMKIYEELQRHYSKCSNCLLCTKYQQRTFEDKDHNCNINNLLKLYIDFNKGQSDYYTMLLAIVNKVQTKAAAAANMTVEKKKQTFTLGQTLKTKVISNTQMNTNDINTKKHCQVINNNYYNNSNYDANNPNNSFNLRLKLYYFLQKYHKKQPTMSMNVYYFFNENFKDIITNKSRGDSNNYNSQINKPIEIELINEYISKLKVSLDEMTHILNATTLNVELPKKALFLSDGIEVLKAKKYRKIHANKHLQQQQYLCLLLSVIYEEFLNVCINKTNQITDEENIYEEVFSSHYDNDKQITLKINVLTWDVTILQIGHELIDYLNKDIKELFPPEFAKEEVGMIKEKFDKEDNKMLLVINNLSNNKNKERMKGFSCITDVEDPIKKYNFLEMKLNKFSHCSTTNYVLALGLYQINKNDIIITKQNRDSADSIYAINNNSTNLNISNKIKAVSLNAFMSKATPAIVFTLHVNTIQYNVLFLETIQGPRYEKTILQGLDEINVSSANPYEGNWNFNQTASMYSSVNMSSSLMSIGSRVQYSLMHISKISKQNNKKWIKRIVAFLICFSIMMIIYSFATMLISISMVNTIKSNYDVFTAFRHINRQYYHTIASVISITCVGHLNSNKCVNYMSDYNKRLKVKHNNDIDLITFIHKENVLKLRDLKTRSAIVEQSVYVLNDPNTSEQFDQTFEYYQISLQNNKMIAIPSHISFREGMKRLINSMSYILIDKAYIKTPIYFINVKPINFDNVYQQENISNGQIEYYHIIINFGNFLVRWFYIYDALNNKINNSLFTLQKVVLVIMIGTLVLHVILVGMIAVLVNFYWFNAVSTLNYLLAGKANPIFLKAYLTKISILKEMLLLYKENPVKLIKNLKECYQKFKNAVTTTTGTTTTQQRDNSYSNELIDLQKCQLLQLFKKKDLWFLFRKYVICLISLTFYYLIFFVFFYLFWNQSIIETYTAFNYINEHSRSEATAFSVFTMLQLMIYGNQTRTSLSSLVHQDDPDYYIYELYRAFDFYYSMEKTQREISHLMHKLSDDFTIHCNDFYENSKDNRFTSIIKESKGIILPQLSSLCNELFPSMNYNNELIVYQDFSKSVYNIIFSMNSNDYKEYEEFLEKDEMHYAELLTYLVFRPLRRLINELTYTKGIENIRNRLSAILISYALISVMTDILSIILLYFGFIMKLYQIEKKVKRLKRVFKLSNKSIMVKKKDLEKRKTGL